MPDQTDDAAHPVTQVTPALRVVRGSPSPADLAAIAAVVTIAAGSSGAPAPAEQPRSWAAYWRLVRTPLSTGPAAWRASAGPR